MRRTNEETRRAGFIRDLLFAPNIRPPWFVPRVNKTGGLASDAGASWPSRGAVHGQGHGRRHFRSEIFGARYQQLLYFDFLQRLLAAEEMGNQGNLGEVLHGFHLHVGALERVAVGHDAMI